MEVVEELPGVCDNQGGWGGRVAMCERAAHLKELLEILSHRLETQKNVMKKTWSSLVLSSDCRVKLTFSLSASIPGIYLKYKRMFVLRYGWVSIHFK